MLVHCKSGRLFETVTEIYCSRGRGGLKPLSVYLASTTFLPPTAAAKYQLISTSQYCFFFKLVNEDPLLTKIIISSISYVVRSPQLTWLGNTTKFSSSTEFKVLRKCSQGPILWPRFSSQYSCSGCLLFIVGIFELSGVYSQDYFPRLSPTFTNSHAKVILLYEVAHFQISNMKIFIP